MTGKLALRSSDADTINTGLSPSDEDVSWAQDFVDRFNSQGGKPKDGSDLPCLNRARIILNGRGCSIDHALAVRRDNAATVSASIPVLRVGSSTGANSGEWLDGTGFPAAAASSKRCCSYPPQNQNAVGTPAVVPKMPTSSLPASGLGTPPPAPHRSAPGKLRLSPASPRRLRR